jgi:membrane-bound metal-dependent hydrolase YbcI (DUF457 family)
MLIKTHLAITIFAILVFFQQVNSQIWFVVIALIATIIPDIDSSSSTIGRNATIVNIFTKHRGFIHSFTLLFLLTLYFALLLPVAALPFFLGYGLHLFADSFTMEGIKPFYPSKKVISWKVKTGGKSETAVFITFILIDLLTFVFLFTNFL